MRPFTIYFPAGLLFLCCTCFSVAQPTAGFVINYTSPVCNPAVISFTNTSAGDAPLHFNWQFGVDSSTDTSVNPSFTYINCGIFTVVLTATDTFGLSDTDTQQVIIHCMPQADFNVSSAIVCDSATIQFTDLSSPPDSIATWLWDFGDSTSGTENTSSAQNPSHFFDSAGAFTVTLTVTSQNGCVSSHTDTLTIYIPQASFTLSDSIFCVKDSVQFTDISLSEDSIVSWSWNFGDFTSGSNTSTLPNPVHVYNEAGNYSPRLTITTQHGCINQLKKQITVKGLPVVDAGTDVMICPSDSVQLNATGANSYLWSPSNSLSDSAISNPFAFPDSTSQFFVEGVDTNGCKAIDSLIVNVSPPPPANAGNDTTICFGTTATLHATGGISFQWSPSIDFINDTIPNPLVTPSATTTYTVTVKDAAGCEAIDSVTVFVSSPPVATIIGLADHYCGNGDPVVLTAEPTGGIFSGDGVTDTLFNPSSLSAGGPYSVLYYYTDSIGCSGTDTAFASILAPPFVSISTADSSLCLHGSPVEFIENPEGGILTGAGITNNTFDPLLAGEGVSNVYYTVTDTSGCSNTDTITMTVFTPPAIDAGNDTSICAGDSIQLQASGGINYVWSPDTSLSNNQVSNPIAFPSSSVQYILTGTDSAGCSNTDSVFITVFVPANVDAGSDTAICSGDSIMLQATGGTIFSWSPAAGLSDTTISNPFAYPQATTLYTVTVNTGTNCPGFDTVLITVHPLPVVLVSHDSSLCLGDSVQLFASGALSYSWQPSTSLTNDQIADPIAFPQATTIYHVTGTDSVGCSNSDSVTLTVLPLPPINAGSDSTICNGDTLQLQASGGIIYLWSPDSTLSNNQIADPLAFPSSSTQYILTGTDGTGCSNNDSVIITVFFPANVSAGADVAICKGDSVMLQATGGSTFSWTPAAGLSDTTISNPVAFPQITTMYKVTVNDGGNCSGSDSVLVTVNSLPVILASHDSSLCFGDSIHLFASGAVSYLWEPSASLSNDQIADPVAFPQATTTYTVTGTDTTGCFNSNSVTLTVIPLPDIDAGIDSAICLGDSLQLMATGGINFIWTPSVSLSDDSISNPVAFPSSSTTFYVTGFDLSGCSNKDSVSIFVLSPNLVDAGNDTSICFGDSATLHASGGLTYSWSPATGLNDATIADPVASPQTTTIYTVTVSVGTDCSFSDSVKITVHALPVVDAGLNASVCPGGSAQLNATGASIYEWSPSNSLSNNQIANPFAFPLSTTIYTVTGTDTFGCKNNDTVSVMVLPAPVADAGNDTAICIGDSVVLHASGGQNYSWTPLSGISDASIADPFAFPSNTTSYIVKVGDSGSCFGFDTVIITVNPLPEANAGMDQTVCAGNSVQLGASGGVQYSWSPTTGLSNPLVSNPFAIVNTGITYTVDVTDLNHCSAKDSVHLSIVPPLNAFISNDTTICEGTTAHLSAGGGINYLWFPSNAVSNPTVANTLATPDSTTIFSVIVSDGICYTKTLYVTVTVSFPNINAGADASITSGETFSFNASGSAGIYQWTPEEGLSCNNCLNPNAVIQNTTTYTVTVTDSSGCKASDDITISVSCGEDAVFIPNAFTPNGNNQNDVLLVRSYGIDKLTFFRIFDRWGHIIFESNDINIGWDGTSNGKPMSPGVFLYTLEAECSNGDVVRKQGNVTLLR